MDKHTWVIPARFDHKDAAAGLKAIEQSGRTAEDLGHAADSASDRFRRAHKAVQSATRGYLELQRALGSSGDGGPDQSDTYSASPSGPRLAANVRPEDWSEPTDVVRGRAGVRPGGNASHPTDDLPTARPAEGHPFAMPARQATPTASGAADGWSADRHDPRATLPIDRGPGRVSGLTDDVRRFGPAGYTPDSPRGRPVPGVDMGSLLSDGPGLPSAGGRRVADLGPAAVADGPCRERPPASSSRGAPAVLPPLFDRDPSSDPPSLAEFRSPDVLGSTRSIPRDRSSSRDDVPARLGDEGVLEGFDPRGSARRMRAPFPVGPQADGSLADGLPAWQRAETGPADRQRTAGSQQGGLVQGSVIERLLREQNELIRQDMHRNTSPPLAAPPPLRGGGIRMGG